MVSCSKDGVRWTLRSEFEPLLDAVLTSPSTVVRQSGARLVTAHRLNGRSYYIKRYFTGRSPWRRILFLLKPHPARQQWEAGLKLEAKCLKIVRVLACGARRSFRGLEESVLITEGFDGVPLTELREPQWTQVLHYVQEMHDRGVIQPDLHSANLLASPESGEVRLIDLGHVRFRKAVESAERLQNLAFLRLSVPIPIDAAAEQLSRQLRKRVCFNRADRCLKENREFGRIRLGSLTWHVRLPFDSEPFRQLAEDPDESLKSGCRLLKTGRRTTVGCRNGMVLKRFNLVKRGSLIKHLFGKSRAKRGYSLSYHLELLGIPTPRPIACADRKRAGFVVRSYCVTEEIIGARTLASILETGQGIGRAVVRNLADLVAALHNEGFSHRDLKGTNLLVGSDGDVNLLDLDGLRFCGSISERRAGANLARLGRAVAGAPAVGREERLRFLLRYYRMRGLRRVPVSHRLRNR